ncbi:hypothetical protein H310_02101 [Aphanomyces invadans]|uniref:HRDC domain-containing protein n=1 Tax=Aphanomyces invadans TaxID=157072 RepID=A0A024UME4_9STRA|nr:hypothetical protein H310_02101 [Aphanomyces invadans]ETW07631.1 hypothetical protein H310_02101 [Aphanomyces invadans]|eukprot:XP_008863724.1 hypothetical protein H310_02101 [Aphanomyces invadans]
MTMNVALASSMVSQRVPSPSRRGNPSVAGRLMNGNRPGCAWRARLSKESRMDVQHKIIHVLRQMKPNAPEAVIVKLPGMSTRLEESLFLMARSEGEYLDESTLHHRIVDLQNKNASRLLKRSSPSGARGLRLNDDQRRRFFGYLQAWRNKTVLNEGVGPWDIMPTQVLAQVATMAPTSLQELEQTCGMGSAWISKYGLSLMRHIDHCLKHLKCGTAAPPPSSADTKRIKTSKSIASPSKGGSRMTPIAPAKPLLKLPTASNAFVPQPAFVPTGYAPASTSMHDGEQMHGLTTFLRGQHAAAAAAPLLPRLSESVISPSIEAYEEELVRLRMVLHQTQQDNAQLHAEIQFLRQQVQQQHAADAAIAACEALVACQTASVNQQPKKHGSAR